MNDTRDNSFRSDTDKPETLEEVLASIRALVSSEAAGRTQAAAGGGDVLLLTPAMRLDGAKPGISLSDGLGETYEEAVMGAPILDEESLRKMINAIVREELQGELGDRITRNLRKMIRRELAQMLEESRSGDEQG